MSKFQNDSIFWIEVEKIKPNPYQPRKSFSDEKLNYLAESIRQYGVLQPLVVTRVEVQKPDGGLMSEYELIAGERRLRASKIAGLSQVPAIIRTEEEDAGMKLELAIIENIQREDLNAIDRAMAFQQLVDEFKFKHSEIAKKVGKSREYVSNSLRLLSLPDEIKNAIAAGQVTEGHARPLLMLKDRPEEQNTLYKEIIYKKLTVRDAEAIARKVAHDKVRKKVLPPDPEIAELEERLAESLGTRVYIERKETGGKLTIDYFSNDDLRKILELVDTGEKKSPTEMLNNYIKSQSAVEVVDSNSIKNTETGINDGSKKLVTDNPESVVVGEGNFAEQNSLTGESKISEVSDNEVGIESVRKVEQTSLENTFVSDELSQVEQIKEKGFLKKMFEKEENILDKSNTENILSENSEELNNKPESLDVPSYVDTEKISNLNQEEGEGVIADENNVAETGSDESDLYSLKNFNI